MRGVSGVREGGLGVPASRKRGYRVNEGGTERVGFFSSSQQLQQNDCTNFIYHHCFSRTDCFPLQNMK